MSAIGLPSGQAPGSIFSVLEPVQLHVSETVTGTSWRLQRRHVPSVSSVVVGCTGHVQAGASLTGATLSATLVDTDGNTSEFSACRAYETVLCREIFRDGLEDNPASLPCTPL